MLDTCINRDPLLLDVLTKSLKCSIFHLHQNFKIFKESRSKYKNPLLFRLQHFEFFLHINILNYRHFYADYQDYQALLKAKA